MLTIRALNLIVPISSYHLHIDLSTFFFIDQSQFSAVRNEWKTLNLIFNCMWSLCVNYPRTTYITKSVQRHLFIQYQCNTQPATDLLHKQWIFNVAHPLNGKKEVLLAWVQSFSAQPLLKWNENNFSSVLVNPLA